MPKKSTPCDYRTFVYNYLTPLQAWIKYRPHEEIPDYLIYENWGTNICTINLWLQYRPNEPITQTMENTIAEAITNIVPNDYTSMITIQHLIENFIQYYNYPIEII